MRPCKLRRPGSGPPACGLSPRCHARVSAWVGLRRPKEWRGSGDGAGRTYGMERHCSGRAPRMRGRANPTIPGPPVSRFVCRVRRAHHERQRARPEPIGQRARGRSELAGPGHCALARRPHARSAGDWAWRPWRQRQSRQPWQIVASPESIRSRSKRNQLTIRACRRAARAISAASTVAWTTTRVLPARAAPRLHRRAPAHPGPTSPGP